VSFRRRIALVSAAAVAVAVVLASMLTYVLTSHQLSSQVDSQLRNRGRNVSLLVRALDEARGEHPGTVHHLRARELRLAALGALGVPAKSARPPSAHTPAKRSAPPTGSAANLFGHLPPGPGQVRGYQQVVTSDGRIVAVSAPSVSLPVDARTRALAAHEGKPFYADATVKGIHLRVLAESLGGGRAVQFAQPLTEVDSLLSRLRLILALIVVGGIALAALLGRLVAGAAVAPLRRLTEATEHVGRTQDLSGRIEPTGGDELGRLASSFNAMLDTLERSMNALDASVHAQRQLVADASHELRTPVTSLRTNIEILQQQGPDMGPDEQRRLLDDVVEQIGELTLLMNDLIDLARGEERRADAEEVRLDALVAEVLERARRNSAGTPLDAELAPTIVAGVPARLERAVANLIDNAVKYSPPGEPVHVQLQAGQLTVRDHGPGISTQDLPHIFDRFYRGAEARGRPGSGLGLAIVRQVVDQHDASVHAEAPAGGGTQMRICFAHAEVVGDRERAHARDRPARAGEDGLAVGAGNRSSAGSDAGNGSGADDRSGARYSPV
jgi:two-component system, OmpR family, sensor histidine kinase MprB